MLKVGEKAPVFSLADQHGRTVELRHLLVKSLALFFYPKDFTPGCTAESCSFRDHEKEIKELGAHIAGISSDQTESHRGFAEKYSLTYPLLSDPGGIVARRYQVGKTLGLIPERVTYLIDTEGVIQLAYRSQFRAKNHADVVMQKLKAMKGQ